MKKVKWFLPVLLLAAFLVMPFPAFAASPSNAGPAKRVLAHSIPKSQSSKKPSPASSCPQIPANVDVMTLSDVELATLGLPSHASLQANPTLWEYIIKGSHRSCKQARPSRIHWHSSFPHPKNGSATPNNIGDGCNATPGSQCQDGIWAGNLALSAGRGKYRSAYMFVGVPNVNLSIPNAEVAFWAGVGGDAYITGNPVLVQSAIVVSVVSGQRYVETDIEVAPNVDPYNLPLCKGLSVNDSIYLYAESNLNNSGYDYFYIKDENDGCSNSCYVGTNNNNPPRPHCPFNGGPSFNSDAASGECIAERVGGTEYGTGEPVIEFNPPGHQEQITHCNVNYTGIGAQAHNYMVLVNGVGGGQLLIGVGPILNNNQDFSFEWHQSS
ncbi:MAG: hypothetical protein ACYDER_08735 [Ktedonobacteraceae bacterium]